MIDFTLGKDVGLGAFGEAGKSTLSAGVRMVRFTSDIKSAFNSDPLYAFDEPYHAKYHYLDDATNQELSQLQRCRTGDNVGLPRRPSPGTPRMARSRSTGV